MAPHGIHCFQKYNALKIVPPPNQFEKFYPLIDVLIPPPRFSIFLTMGANNLSINFGF